MLVVDDDPDVREVVARIVERMGWTVMVAADGAEALALSDRHKGGIRVAVVDRTMPAMSGEELLVTLRKRVPNLPAVLMSGYDDAPPDDGLTTFVPKPFMPEELRAAVRRVVG